LLKGLFQVIGDRLRVAGQHGRLVDHAKPFQIAGSFESIAGPPGEVGIEFRPVPVAADEPRQHLGLLHVLHHERLRVRAAVAERRPGLLVLGLAMDDHGVVLVAQLGGPFPDLLDKRTGRVVPLDVDANRLQLGLELERRAEGRHDDHIVRRQGLERGDDAALGVHQEADALGLEVRIDLRVVDHLAEEPQPFAGVFRHGLVGDLDGVFHPEAESEMAGKNETHCSEIQHRRRQIPLPRVRHLAQGLDLPDDGRTVGFRDVERAHEAKVKAAACPRRICPV